MNISSIPPATTTVELSADRLYIEVRILIDRIAEVRSYERFVQLEQALESYATARAGATVDPDPQSKTTTLRPPGNDAEPAPDTKRSRKGRQ